MTTPNYPYPGQPGAQGYGGPSGYPPPNAAPQGYPAAQGYPAPPEHSAQPQPYPAQPQPYPAQPQGYPAPQGNQPQPGYPPGGGFPPPQQPGQPLGGFPPPGQPPAQSGGGKKVGKLLLKIGAVLVIGLVLLGARLALRSDGEKIDVGQCAKLSGTTFKAEFATKECSDPEANYIVAARLDGSNANCPTKDYASYYQTGRKGYTLCLRLNVKEGDCVKSEMMAASKKVACTSAADYKIGRIVQGTADKSACGSKATEDEVIVYPKPQPITLCLVSPK